VAEFLGSLLLAATVVGSGIMGERLADGNAAVALLANSAATVAVLGVLITLLAPISGAHFNPAVTLVMVLRGLTARSEGMTYFAAQILGCCAGSILANAMFEHPLIELSTRPRTGVAQWLAEFVATFGLLLVILLHRPGRGTAWLVAAWIGAAYWFTASTSFANPAITIGRTLSDSFAGIRPGDASAFVVAQFMGAVAALPLAKWLVGSEAATRRAPREGGVP